ncbi:mitochondrial 54S ribosomal protein mL54 [Aspergillus saccharolyticus JOP 1030-1]|uniref:Large ribosomal subunit protein mL54 n=1 Tax=Aspergillus saccharolyticus JOP 1030-1 TaxID=1450539 RepID=A0A318ZEC5_9EURO|nr:hypothetical protein BP01DRAFT_347933 [Aspergillus saccharolyticus JOP 1030-1]PYH41930.1 hypothetical protein BP01DRAFT_347933 [Aspergillus saccharolyticus JOP 1030-1]
MICQRCRTGILSRFQQQTVTSSALAGARQLLFPIQRTQFRNYSEGKPTVSAAPPPPKPRQPGVSDVTVPSAVSSATPGVSQPLSTPTDGVHSDVHPGKPRKAEVKRPASICVAGTKMNGLNYFKNKPDVVALEDSEYPDWLWGLLDEKKKGKAEQGGVDPSTLNKKQRKRYEKKMAARAATLPPVIPIHEHATDITPAPYNRGQAETEDSLAVAAESIEKRTEITRSARDARRKAIREANFLRGL